VVDFGELKQLVGTWIDNELDHNVILYAGDHDLVQAITPVSEREPFLMDEVPTAENIARLIFDQASRLVNDQDLRVCGVRVWETPNCYADYIPEEI
jgi:6-pyruvoyltetrahydropterin/6-carboxytetrahydropterin synthase